MGSARRPARRVEAISIAGRQHRIVLLDAEGTPARAVVEGMLCRDWS